MKTFAFLVLVIALPASALSAAAPVRPDADNLTRETAEFRAAQVRTVTYDLEFTLKKGSRSYDGRTKINLELARTDAPLSIDYMGKAPEKILVNGAVVTDPVRRTGSFDIPARYLKPRTVVEVA